MSSNWVIMPYVDNHAMTADALRDVLNQRILHLQVLAIDNGGWLKDFPLPPDQLDPRVLFWHYQPPLLSLSTVWNTALKMVWEVGGEHALVVNNDIRLPRGTYAALVEVQRLTGAWFVSACNVGEAWYPGMLDQSAAVTPDLLRSRGGPDFSCFLITRECHRYFQFDEQFIPAYFEDNDYHRRLQLAGFGEKIFGVPVPYLHLGSGTLRSVEHVNQGWNERFQANRDYYTRKWGGPPQAETYDIPFNEGGVEGAWVRYVLTGQGRPGHIGPTEGLPDGQAV